MYQTREDIIRENISNKSLITCARIAELIKEPPYIPYYEAYTYELVARYFGLTEKRVHNAYVSHRYIFENDCTMVTGKQMLNHVRDVKSLGKSYGYLCEYDNGVVAQISYTYNMIFDHRALLNFAVIFKDESEVAKKIFDVLDKNEFNKYGYLKRKKPWFYEIKDEPLHATAKIDDSSPVVCPYLTMVTEDNKQNATPSTSSASSKAQSKKYFKTRKVNQLDSNGNTVYVWDSLTEAANILGIDISSIYNCCAGKQKTAGATHRGVEGKYRFAYAN